MVTITNGAFLTLYGANGAQLMVNVVGCLVTGNVTFNQALANALGSPIKSAWTTNLSALCANSTTLVRVAIRDMRTANQPEFRDSGAGVAGTAVGDALPRQTAACVTLRTASSGKSFRGRIYLGGFAEAVNDATGNATSQVGTGIVAFVQAIDTALKNNGMALAVCSRPANRYIITKTTFLPDGTTQDDIIGRGNQRLGGATAVTIIESRNTVWETQRRRMNSRGAVPTLAVASAEL